MLRKKSCSESNARDMLDMHINMVGNVLNTSLKTIILYLQDDIVKAKKNARLVDKLETEADNILRDFTRCLCAGAFLPLFRKNIFQMVVSVDDVANAAEAACDFCLSQRPEIPKALRGAFDDITHANMEMFPLLSEAVENLKLGTFGRAADDEMLFQKVVTNISMHESNIDDLEWKLTRDIFNTDLPLANKMHLQALLSHITKVSDLIEDVSDRLYIMFTREAL